LDDPQRSFYPVFRDVDSVLLRHEIKKRLHVVVVVVVVVNTTYLLKQGHVVVVPSSCRTYYSSIPIITQSEQYDWSCFHSSSTAVVDDNEHEDDDSSLSFSLLFSSWISVVGIARFFFQSPQQKHQHQNFH
jgi:hypothetical protein